MSDQNAGETPPASPTPPAPAYPPPAPQYAPPAVAAPPPAAVPPAPPAYGQATAPAYAPPGYTPYPAAPKTNVLAIVSLVSSLVGLFILPLIGSVAAVITGHMSLRQLKTSGEGGRGMALAGTIIGWVGVGLILLIGIPLIIFLFTVVLSAGAASTGYLS